MNEQAPTVTPVPENVEVVSPQPKKFPIKIVLLIIFHLLVLGAAGYFASRYMAILQANKANEQKLANCITDTKATKVDWISYQDAYMTGLLLWTVDYPPRIECANLHWESTTESTDSKVTRVNYDLFDPVSDETLMFISIYYNETAENAYKNTSESGMAGTFTPLVHTTFNSYDAYTTSSDSGAHLIYIQRGNDLVTISTWSSDISKDMLKSFKFIIP